MCQTVWNSLYSLAHCFPFSGRKYCLSIQSFISIQEAIFFRLAFQQFCNAFVFILLWVLYLSVYQIGQVFLYFQWDIMLLESGCITILVAPLFYNSKSRTSTPRDRICFWLIKWLFFRLMFASGVVKLTSKCPMWWGLTGMSLILYYHVKIKSSRLLYVALTVHYESQCIPTTLAWYFHHLPVWFHKLSVVATLIIEIILPFLFFSPFRKLRVFACYGQVRIILFICQKLHYKTYIFYTKDTPSRIDHRLGELQLLQRLNIGVLLFFARR